MQKRISQAIRRWWSPTQTADNHSGNIHTHIVINSVRKKCRGTARTDMDKPNEEKAGYKHRSTNRFLEHLKREVMADCVSGEGLHQVDLLSPAPEKSDRGQEFPCNDQRARKSWRQINQEIVRKGSQTSFHNIPGHRRIFCGRRLMNVLDQPRNFKEFQSLLLEN